jgi:hypothetical protein
MTRTTRTTMIAAAVVVFLIALVLLNATGALAAGDGEKVGENVGKLLGGWAKSLYIGIAAIVALMFLFNRKFADLAIFMIAAIMVGGFVLAPQEVVNTVRGIWSTIAG